MKEAIQHHYLWGRKLRENSLKKREKKQKAGGKYQELICGHSPERSGEAMEGMKLLMEISNTDKHPEKCNLQKSSRQSGRGAVRIHKPQGSAKIGQPPSSVVQGVSAQPQAPTWARREPAGTGFVHPWPKDAGKRAPTSQVWKW